MRKRFRLDWSVKAGWGGVEGMRRERVERRSEEVIRGEDRRIE